MTRYQIIKDEDEGGWGLLDAVAKKLLITGESMAIVSNLKQSLERGGGVSEIGEVAAAIRKNPKTKAPTGKTKEVIDSIMAMFRADPKATFHPSIFTAPAIRWLKKTGMLRVAYYNTDNQPVYGLAQNENSKENPSMNTVKAFGNYSVRLEGSSLTAFIRYGGNVERIARKYYSSPEAAEKAYKRITSAKKLESWAERNKRQNPKKGKTMAKRKNPRTPLTKATAIPKGKRAGEHFTKGGKTYVVISYVQPSTGKRVRFARRVKK